MNQASLKTTFGYVAQYKPNQLILGSGQTGIVSGWTDSKTIAKKLDSSEFAVIGQLYSAVRGINFLIRNLLCNPHVRHLVVLNATKEDQNAGSVKCLIDFFRNGFELGKSDTGRECWLIDSSVPGYIDKEIPGEDLDLLRDSIDCQEAYSVFETVNLTKSFSESAVEPWGTPKVYPLVEILPTVLPGQRYGHRIEGKTIAETWVKIIHRIKTTGTLRPTGYDDRWQELIDLMAVVTDEPADFYFPHPNYLPIDREFLEHYKAQMLEDAPYREGVKYTYGQRMRSWFGRDQVEQVITKLINEIDAASAVMNLWDSGGNVLVRDDGSSDHEHSGSPCLNHIWVRVVDEEISLTATLRSNDMFAAWPANAMGLRAMQRHVRDEIARRSKYDLTMGPLITLSQSAHIYGDTFENVDRLIEAQYAKICKSRDYVDPAGNFLVELINGQIKVDQLTPGGEVVTSYTGRDPLQLSRKICDACPAIKPEHIAYLAIEMQKASECLNTNRQYVQDK